VILDKLEELEEKLEQVDAHSKDPSIYKNIKEKGK